MSLEGKTVIVTGAAGGLGQTIAEMYLKRAANVVICDINPTRLADTQAAFEKSHAQQIHAVETDVANEDSVKELIGAALRRFGKLDIVVNNAAVMDKFDPAGTCEKETWDRVIGINATGPMLVTKHAIKAMEKNSPVGGLIVNIGSNACLMGLAGGVAYVASKHALLGLTKNTAGFYGSKGIYCTALVLGGMDTTNIRDAFADGLNTDGLKKMQETQPGYRSVKVEDVAAYVGFVSEEGGSVTNGSYRVMNGNWPEA